MVRFSYRERGSEEQSTVESIESLYNMIEELDQDPGFADVQTEDFSAVYRSQDTVNIECFEQLHEVAKEEGELVKAEAEFVFDNGENSYLNFSYNQNKILQRAHIESDSPRLAELAEEVILLEPTLPSRGISYLKDIIH